MFMYKGIIALDIDGTVTVYPNELHENVVKALHRYALDRWAILFITGRPFQWSEEVLRVLPFSYALAVQNGALLMKMPERDILIRYDMEASLLPPMEEMAHQFQTDFVIYSGIENNDYCYYRPNKLPASILAYGLKRAARLGEKWQPLDSFAELPISRFGSIKFFAEESKAMAISREIEKRAKMHAPLNRDPYNPEFFVVQATDAQANKGNILKAFMQKIQVQGPVIAAGDDYNDVTMLQEADVKIVMANAPPFLLALADVIAPPAAEQGLIQGLEEATKRFL